MTSARDDLGHPVPVTGPARRVVSLVPSLTESVAATRPEALAGATDWCTHPADLDVPRVRGTKNPDLAAIRALRPDLVLANQEENRRLDVERLRAAGVPVWVTVIETVDQALDSLARMFGVALGWPVPDWLTAAGRVWRRPAPATRIRAVIPVWRDPWMVVGSATFTGDLAARLGLDNVYGDDPGRYPRVDLAGLAARDPELVVLPDEPYAFSPGDGPEMFPGRRVALVEGRALTWYGPSLVTARDTLTAQLDEWIMALCLLTAFRRPSPEWAPPSSPCSTTTARSTSTAPPPTRPGWSRRACRPSWSPGPPGSPTPSTTPSGSGCSPPSGPPCPGCRWSRAPPPPVPSRPRS
jgi:hypothetical protein